MTPQEIAMAKEISAISMDIVKLAKSRAQNGDKAPIVYVAAVTVSVIDRIRVSVPEYDRGIFIHILKTMLGDM